MSPTPKPPQENKRRSLPGFSSFKRAKKEESSAYQMADKVFKEIGSIPPLIDDANNREKLQALEAQYARTMEPGIKAPLDKAKLDYTEISGSSVKNVIYTAKLYRKIEEVNKAMEREIKTLQHEMLDNSHDVYIQWRKIEQQAETLKYLAGIAERKLHSSAGMIRQASDEGAKKLEKALSKVSTNLEKFKEARAGVSEYLELTPKPSLKTRE